MCETLARRILHTHTCQYLIAVSHHINFAAEGILFTSAGAELFRVRWIKSASGNNSNNNKIFFTLLVYLPSLFP